VDGIGAFAHQHSTFASVPSVCHPSVWIVMNIIWFSI
jgi:hypothetical protein